MKTTKLAIASILALSAVTASALEVGLTTISDYSGARKNTGYGLTVSQPVGTFDVAVGYAEFNGLENNQARFSLVGGRDVAKFGTVIVTPKLGVVYLNNQHATDGYALTLGVGATLPVTNTVSFTLDVARQYGQERVESFDGNTVTAGLAYRF